jgi:hypothetical protein
MKTPITLALLARPTPVTRCMAEVPPSPCRVLGRVNSRRQRLHMGGHDMPLHGGCQPLETPEVAGRTPPQAFYVTGRHTGRTRLDIAAAQGLTPFVGRQHELATLGALLEKMKHGHGQIVGVLGDAGMGKSRLLLKFRRRLQGEHVT